MTNSLTRKRVGAAVAAVAAAFALGIGSAGVADAKITPQCTNGGGQQPGGQQPTCTGNGLDDESVNPQGKLPPGHN
ncbi:hypothetical protein FE633_28870 [Streptomyces montanus]|uniref:Intersectin-EH binding protein Ibp1 n=1 Tax=Streptomyces montanus TaxID=2580423 RepID=A0A5R9FTI0_9ACTN|nr:hypothetical protein [Streptomyces montanus]TLS42835.1 hypothetical protein FE633_28870 [Streptomyces montanus]